MHRFFYVVFAVAIAACSNGEGPLGSGGEFSTERKLAIRSWRTPERIDLFSEPHRKYKNVLDLEAGRGRLLMLTSVARDVDNLPDWHRELFVLEHDGVGWTETGSIQRTGLFNAASLGIGSQNDAFVFWAADPPDDLPPDDAPVNVVVHHTALYGCLWQAGACSKMDSLVSERRSGVAFSDVEVTEAGHGRVLAEHAFTIRDMEVSKTGITNFVPWSGIFPSLVSTRGGFLSVAGGGKLETTTGFRLYARKGSGSVWEGSRTAGESVQTSDLLYDSSGTAHVIFWAFPGSGEATLYHAMSTDDGLTWSDAVDVGFIPRGFPTGRPQLEEDMNGTLHLIWGASFRFGETEFFENQYIDGAWTSTAQWTVGDTGFKWGVHLTRSEDGRLHAAWQSNNNLYYSVYE